MNNDLIDIGVNLTSTSFDKDRDDVMQRALDAGVKAMILTGSSMDESKQALIYAKTYPFCFSTAGVHPHDAKDFLESDYLDLKLLAGEKKVVAIGETGLDFNRDFSPRDVQESVFERQIELSIETEMPLFCHERDASTRFAEMVKAYRDDIKELVVHCFTADKRALYSYLDLDLHIGITGWVCDERRGTHLYPLLSDIPSNRLMIETDAPYLLPRTLGKKPKNRRNEPAYLTEVLNTVAQHTGKSAQQVAEETTATAKAFFNLDLGEQ